MARGKLVGAAGAVFGSMLMPWGPAACKPPAESAATTATDVGNPTGTGTGTGGSGQIVIDDTNTDTGTVSGTGTGLQVDDGARIEVAVVPAGTLAFSGAALAEVGQADGTQLESMQYRFTSIQICEDMEINGTGFSGTTNCLELYRGPDDGDYDTFGYAEAKADTTNYVDLLDPESVKKLSRSVNVRAQDAHEYKFGLVNFFQPIKVRASVPIGDGTTTLYTKDAPLVIEDIGADHYQKFVSYVDAITTGPAATAVVRHNNGGAWFRFAKPLVITADDVAQKKVFRLDLTFNPDGIVTGGNDSGGKIIGGTGTFPAQDDGDPAVPQYPTPVYSIEVPMIGFTPIAHKEEEKVVKETYLAHVVGATYDFDMRIELYSIKDDPAAAVYGADLQSLVLPGATRGAPAFYDPFFVTLKEDGEIVLETYEHKSIFNGLKRLASVGDTAAGGVYSGYGRTCFPDDPDNECHTDPTYEHETPVTFELVGRVELP